VTVPTLYRADRRWFYFSEKSALCLADFGVAEPEPARDGLVAEDREGSKGNRQLDQGRADG
jgi:hypothetical protein